MGAVKRDREREEEGEKADIYCGCLMTGKEIKNGRASQGRNVEGEVLRQNEKILGEEKCERRVLQGKRDCDFKEACGC